VEKTDDDRKKRGKGTSDPVFRMLSIQCLPKGVIEPHAEEVTYPTIQPRILYFWPSIPRPLGGGPDVGLSVLPLLLLIPCVPSAASLSKKSCHNSAKLSLLLELLAISIGSDAALSDGVDGVRPKGDKGMRRLVVLDAVPGRASPACSRCSVGLALVI